MSASVLNEGRKIGTQTRLRVKEKQVKMKVDSLLFKILEKNVDRHIVFPLVINPFHLTIIVFLTTDCLI